MMSKQCFKEENLPQTEEVEEEFNKICPDEIQMRFINIFSEFVAQYIPINELIIKGFLNKSIRVWQIENKKNFYDQRTMPFRVQFNVLKTLLALTKSELTKILIKSEQESKLEFAVNEFLDFYKRNFNPN